MIFGVDADKRHDWASWATAIGTLLLALVTIVYVIKTNDLVITAQDQLAAAEKQTNELGKQVQIGREQTENLLQQLNIARGQVELSKKQLELMIEPNVSLNEDVNIQGRDGVFSINICNYGIADISDLKIYARSLAIGIPNKVGPGFLVPLSFRDEPITEAKFIGGGDNVTLKIDLNEQIKDIVAHTEYWGHPPANIKFVNQEGHNYSFHPVIEFTLRYSRTADRRTFVKTVKYPLWWSDGGKGIEFIAMPQHTTLEDVLSVTQAAYLMTSRSTGTQYEMQQHPYVFQPRNQDDKITPPANLNIKN